MLSYNNKFPIKCSGGVVYQIQCEVCGLGVADVGKTVNTIHERFFGPNVHLHPATNESVLLQHLSLETKSKLHLQQRDNYNTRLL